MKGKRERPPAPTDLAVTAIIERAEALGYVEDGVTRTMGRAARRRRRSPCYRCLHRHRRRLVAQGHGMSCARCGFGIVPLAEVIAADDATRRAGSAT